MRALRRQIASATVLGVISALAFAGLSLANAGPIEPVGLTAWSPSSVSINAGESVSFKNTSGTMHGVTWTGTSPSSCTSAVLEGTGSSGNFEGSCTFNSGGTFTFRCTVHLAMTGEVIVTGGPEKPTVTTGEATVGSDTTATLKGTVNPHGESTKYFFKYGKTTAYGTETTKTDLPSTGSSPQSVSVAISGLEPGTTYQYKLFAESIPGLGEGANRSFKTTGPPTATTTAATGIGATEATLHGTVNPDGHATTYFFEYGKEVSYGEKTAGKSAGSGTASVAASGVITGLAPETTYHFRVVAEGLTTVPGGDLTFKTGSKSEPPPEEEEHKPPPEEEHRPPVEEQKPPTPEPTPPDTKIAPKPPAKTHDRTPTIKFKASVAGASFQCSIDSKPFKACRSPFTAPSLKPGRHRIRVKAVLGGVSDPTPASYSFKVLAKKR